MHFSSITGYKRENISVGIMCDNFTRINSKLQKCYYYFRYRAVSFISVEYSMRYISQKLNINRLIYIKLDLLTHYLARAKESKEPLFGKKFFSDSFIQPGDWDTYKKPLIPDYYYENHKRAVTFRSTYQILKRAFITVNAMSIDRS